jgi:hypothetical protein
MTHDFSSGKCADQAQNLSHRAVNLIAMTHSPTIPARLATLALALQPALTRLQRRIDEKPAPDTPHVDETTCLQTGLSRLASNAADLGRKFDQLTNDVLANEEAMDGDVYRAAGRIEAYLDGFLDDRDSVCRALLPGDFAVARDLLAGAYRHNLIDIRDGLAHFIRVLEAPLAEARRRGLPESGPLKLDLRITLTPSPEMAQLNAWATRKQQGGDGSGISFWGLLGGLTLAAFLLSLSGNDCDCGMGD